MSEETSGGSGERAASFGRFKLLAPAEEPWGAHTAYDAVDMEGGGRALVVVLDPELSERSGFEAEFERLAAGDPLLAGHGIGHRGAWVAIAGPAPRTAARMAELEGAVAPERAAALVAGAARAMEGDHAAGRRNGNGGPQTVLIAGEGGDERAVLAPRALNPALYPAEAPDPSGHHVPVPLDCISPEEARGEQADPRTDVYALGCTLHVLLTGRDAYERDTEAAVLWAHVSEPPPSLEGESPPLPEWAGAVLADAMAKDRDERIATGPALADALEAKRAGPALHAVAGEPVPVEPLSGPPAGARARRVTEEVLQAPARLTFRSTVAPDDLARAYPLLRPRPGVAFTIRPDGDHELLELPGADLMDAFEGDGSPLSFVQASLLARDAELRGDRQWFLHRLVLDAPEPPSGPREWHWLAPPPDRWAPAVERRPDRTVVVTFHTAVDTFEQRLFRHVDHFTGPGYRFTPRDEQIARHPWGPRIPW